MDNVIEALGRGKKKQGKGLSKGLKEVYNYIKNNKRKILKAALISAPFGIAAGIAAGRYVSRRRRAPRQPIEPARPFVPFAGPGFRLPLRPGEPARPVEGAGLKEINDKVVNFVKKHHGKIATVGKMVALAALYKNKDKIIDYLDSTRLGQTPIGQRVLGNLGYVQGHIDVYSGLLQHLWDRYRRERLGQRLGRAGDL
jgi:hypothetical protein